MKSSGLCCRTVTKNKNIKRKREEAAPITVATVTKSASVASQAVGKRQ